MLEILVVVLGLSGGYDFSDEGYCSRIRSGALQVEEERAYLLELCNAEIASHEGPIVLIEGGFLPILKNYYLMIPDGNDITLSSSRAVRGQSFSELTKWPYGSIWISRADTGEQRPSVFDLEEVNSRLLMDYSKACNMDFRLLAGQASHASTEFSTQIYELVIGESLIRMSRGSIHLAMVSAETYARINCRG